MLILFLLFNLIFFWLGGSFVLNFIVTKKAFVMSGDFFSAGKLAMSIFETWNQYEFGLSLLIFILLLKYPFKKNKYLLIGIGVFLLSLIVTYNFYLTPKIINLTHLWIQAEELKNVSINGYSDIQQTHQYFHRIYIVLDSIKILSLLVMMVLLSGRINVSSSSHS